MMKKMKTKMMLFRCLLASLCLCASLPLEAQTLEPNLKFGKPTDAELNMTTYSPDPDAEAVVLCYTTDTYYDIRAGGFLLMTDVKVRIKVLKDGGKDYANVSIPYLSGEANRGYHERIVGLKATAYNMENGKLVKTKMTSDMEFTETVDKENMLRKFTVPQVKVGTVFEYQYRKESDYFFHIDTWHAQRSIPTLYASYELILPEWFQFNVDQTGHHHLDATTDNSSVTFNLDGDILRCVAHKYRFIGEQLPALKDDDYIWCPTDYCDKVTSELRRIEIPGSVYKDYTTTWEKIGSQLMDDEDFGGRIRRANPLKDEQAAAAIPADASAMDKTVALYQLLKQHLKWNGQYKLFGKGAHDLKKQGEGSNADLNFVLLNMLRDAGLTAYPVVLRLRTHGRMPFTHPTIKELTTFVVGVMASDQNMLLIDASAEDGYVNVLPSRLLVDQARVIKPDGSGFMVNLQKASSSQVLVNNQMQLSADGSINGTVRITYQGNGALAERRQYRSSRDSIDFVKSQSSAYGIDIQSFAMQGRDDFSPQVREDITFTSHADATADHIYLNPFVFRPVKESPFQAATRDIPIEYPYPSALTVRSSIRLPEGYEVEECPENLVLQTPDGSLTARVLTQPGPGVVGVQIKFDITNTLIPQTSYQEIRQFYETLTAKLNEMIILKKS